MSGLKTFAGQKAKITTVRGFVDLAKNTDNGKTGEEKHLDNINDRDDVLIKFLPDHDKNKKEIHKHTFKNKTDKGKVHRKKSKKN